MLVFSHVVDNHVDKWDKFYSFSITIMQKRRGMIMGIRTYCCDEDEILCTN